MLRYVEKGCATYGRNGRWRETKDVELNSGIWEKWVRATYGRNGRWVRNQRPLSAATPLGRRRELRAVVERDAIRTVRQEDEGEG